MSAAVAENVQRPNTITVAAGTGIGVLMVAPVGSRQDTGEPSTATAASPTPRTAPPDRWPPASDPGQAVCFAVRFPVIHCRRSLAMSELPPLDGEARQDGGPPARHRSPIPHRPSNRRVGGPASG